MQAGVCWRDAVEAGEGAERRGGIGRAAADARGDGEVLFQRYCVTSVRGEGGGEGVGGGSDEVAVPRGIARDRI